MGLVPPEHGEYQHGQYGDRHDDIYNRHQHAVALGGRCEVGPASRAALLALL